MWVIEIVVYIIVLFFLVKALQYGIVWVRLMQRRNQLPYNEWVDISQIPENLNPIWAQTHQALSSLGFQYAYSQKATQTNKVAFYQVYVHPHIPAFASVSSTLLPGWIRSFDVIFTSIFDNGKTMITTDCLDNITLPLPKSFQANTYYFADLSKQWLTHQQWVNQIRQKENTEPIYCTVEEFLQNQNDFAKEALSYQVENGWAVKVGLEGAWRYSYKGAAKLLAPIFYVSKKLTEISKKISKEQSANIIENKNTLPNSTSFLSESSTQAQLNADILAFEQAIADENNRVKWGWVTKAGLFLVSVVVAALAFGISFSWQTVFILLGVLLIHELGHLAGMILFGFKDTQVLFLPFLGAVTIGDKEDATPLQKLIIYLLGPVPGVIGGFIAAYVYLVTLNPLWYEIALISIILNYINLLPILPLDGGRVLEALFYIRFPRAQTVIYIINSLVLFLAWWLLNDKIILFLAISTIISLPLQWQFSIAASRVNRLLPKEHDRKIRLQTIFQVLTAPPFIKQTWAERYLLAKKLASHFSNVMPTVKVMIIGGFIYLLMLGLPIYGLIGWVAVDWWSARNYIPANTSIEEPIEKPIEKPDWETKLKQVTDPAKRWDILVEAGDWQLEEDYELENDGISEKAKQYYLEAFEIAKGFGLKDQRYLESLNKLVGVLPEKEVKDYYLQTLSQMQKNLDANDIQIASLLERLAFLSEKRSDEEIQYLERALEIRNNNLSITNNDTDTSLYLIVNNSISLADLYIEKQEAEKAKKLLIQTVEFCESNKKLKDRSIGVLEKLSDIYLKQGLTSKARLILTEKYDKLASLPDTKQELYFSTLINHIAWICILEKDFETANKLFEKKLALETGRFEINQLGLVPWFLSRLYGTDKQIKVTFLPHLLDICYLKIQEGKLDLAQETFNQIEEILKANKFQSLEQYAKSIDQKARFSAKYAKKTLLAEENNEELKMEEDLEEENKLSEELEKVDLADPILLEARQKDWRLHRDLAHKEVFDKLLK